MGHDQCPTCGAKLGSLRDHAHARVCTSCQRANPRGFHYCGFCAAPMENTELRGRVTRAAAPPGGWPSLARELLEVRFFLERGDIGEAFEMVQLLRQRWPGHPQLEEFHGMSRTARPRRVHTGVNEVVDAVLADSADWASRTPRRAAPRWQAPAAAAPGRRTAGHEVVAPESAAEAPRARVPEGGVRKRVEDGSGLRDRDTRRGHRAVAPHPVVPVINPAFRDSGPHAVVAAEPPAARTVAPPPSAGPVTRARAVASDARAPLARVSEASPGPAKARGKQRVVQDDDTAVFHRAPVVPRARATEPSRRTAPQLVPPEPPPGLAIDPPHADGTPQLVAASGSLDASDEVDAAPPVARVQVHVPAPAPEPPSAPDRTVVGPAPTRGPGWSPPKGLTMAVDALQPARPYATEGDADEDGDAVDGASQAESESGSRRKLRGKAQAKKKAKRRPAPPIENDDDPESADKREAQAKRRAAKFGQSIVGR